MAGLARAIRGSRGGKFKTTAAQRNRFRRNRRMLARARAAGQTHIGGGLRKTVKKVARRKRGARGLVKRRFS